MEGQVEAEQVILDSKEPLGVSAQDPSLAPHVSATRPCIDTVLCDPGTTGDHLVTSGEDECTSRLQRKKVVTEELEQEA